MDLGSFWEVDKDQTKKIQSSKLSNQLETNQVSILKRILEQ